MSSKYETTTTSATEQIVQHSPTADVWSLFVFSIGASGGMLLSGALYLLARFGYLPWSGTRVVIFLAAIPWAIIGLVLIVAVWKKCWILLESLTGLDLDNNGQIGQIPDIRIVPYRGPAFTVGGVAPDDWRYFVSTICNTGDWTQKTWRGQRMPSGRKCDNEYWSMLVGGLKRIGVIINAGPRSSGNLTTTDAAEILDLLGLNGLTELN